MHKQSDGQRDKRIREENNPTRRHGNTETRRWTNSIDMQRRERREREGRGDTERDIQKEREIHRERERDCETERRSARTTSQETDREINRLVNWHDRERRFKRADYYDV